MENLSAPPPFVTLEGYIPSTNVFSPDDTKILTHRGLYDLTQKELLWVDDLRLAALSDDGNHFVKLQLNGAGWDFARPRIIDYGDASNGNILFQKDEREEFWRTNVAINTTGGKTIIVAKVRNDKIRAWKVTPTGGIKPMGKTNYSDPDCSISRVDIRPDGKDVVLVELYMVKVWDLTKNEWRFRRYFDFNKIKAPDMYRTEDKAYLEKGVQMYLPVILCTSYNNSGSQIALGSGIYYKRMSAEYNSLLWKRMKDGEIEKVKSAKVRIIDSETGDDVKVFALPRDYDTVNSVSFSPNDSQVACSACNYFGGSYSFRGNHFELMQTIMVFDIETGACLLHCPFDFGNLRKDYVFPPTALNVAYAHNGNQIAFGDRLLDIRNANRIQRTVREFPVIATVLGGKDLEVNVSRSANMVQLEVIGFVNGERHPLTIRVSLYRILGNETNIDFEFVPQFLKKFVDESVLNELNNSEITDLHEACISLFNAYNDTPTASSSSGVKRKRELKLKF